MGAEAEKVKSPVQPAAAPVGDFLAILKVSCLGATFSSPPANHFAAAYVKTIDLHESRTSDGSASPMGVGPEGGGASDEELLQRCCVSGDSAAFESLVHRYEG